MTRKEYYIVDAYCKRCLNLKSLLFEHLPDLCGNDPAPYLENVKCEYCGSVQRHWPSRRTDHRRKLQLYDLSEVEYRFPEQRYYLYHAQLDSIEEAAGMELTVSMERALM